MKKAIAAIGALSLIAMVVVSCGRGNETSLGPDPLPAATYLSGYDGSTVDVQVSDNGGQLTVSANGFLNLDTLDRHRPVYLWPNDSHLTARDTFSYVYGGNELNSLNRVGDSTQVVSVIAHGVLATDPTVMEAVRIGVGEDNALLATAGVNVRFAVGAQGQVQANLYLDPKDPLFDEGSTAGAGTYNTNQNNVRVSSRIVVGTLKQARMSITWKHELVHVIGLSHSLHLGPMMASTELYKHQDFSDTDALYVKMLFRREPGTRFTLATTTENDRGAVQSSSLKGETLIVCEFKP